MIEKMCARRAMEGCSRQPDGQGSVAINPMARGSVFGVERLILRSRWGGGGDGGGSGAANQL